MTDPETTQPESDPDRESDRDPDRDPSQNTGSLYDSLSRADKLGFYVAAVLLTLAGLGIAFLIYVGATALVTWLLGA